ncbi:CDP-alcohol phosphatidyltransferase family protein [Sphaerisporangium perillae]|uniref:CDP-alcohol phosphatidyltransferase family protein n=1 Tax=Sphaerisporangium perillae TaxID=2935860 RepID=UPI002010AF50|nr:CDP-alcohol phosphatidyltransferase family protein [Sphaerisporangium perillae]
MRSYSLDDVRATRKRRDSWWTVFMVDPVACRVALFVANRTEITPNALTRCSLVLGMASAACFAANHLVLGAALFYVSFMVDCVDGKIARLKGTGTPFGLWLDYVGDRIRVVCCAFGLAYGQYAATGRLAYVLLGAGIAILDLFRYVNAPQMKRVRQTVKARRRAARREELDAMRDAMAVESLAHGSQHDMPYAADHDLPPYGSTGSAACEPPDPAYDPYEPYDQMSEAYRLQDDRAADPAEPYRFRDQPADPAEPVRYRDQPADPPEPFRCQDEPGEPPKPADHLTEPYSGPVIPRQAFPSTESVTHRSFSPAPPSSKDRPSGQEPPAGGPGNAPPGSPGYDQASRHRHVTPYSPAVPPPPEGAEPPIGLRQRLGRFLARHRVRTHLMSGIEFHAAVFVLGPLIGPAALLPVTTGAGALLVLNEIFLVYRMWLSTRALATGAPPTAPGPDDERHVRTDPFYTGV